MVYTMDYHTIYHLGVCFGCVSVSVAVDHIKTLFSGRSIWRSFFFAKYKVVLGRLREALDGRDYCYTDIGVQNSVL